MDIIKCSLNPSHCYFTCQQRRFYFLICCGKMLVDNTDSVRTYQVLYYIPLCLCRHRDWLYRQPNYFTVKDIVPIIRCVYMIGYHFLESNIWYNFLPLFLYGHIYQRNSNIYCNLLMSILVIKKVFVSNKWRLLSSEHALMMHILSGYKSVFMPNLTMSLWQCFHGF